MLFMASICWGISLKFLCTSLVWGWWVTLALFDDIILLLKPFLSAGWLTSACATGTHHYILTPPTYWQTGPASFHWEFFKWALVCWFLLTHMLTLYSCLLCVSHGRLQVAVTFWTVRVRDFGATCNFLVWDTGCIFPIFLPCTYSLLAV